MRLSVKGGHVVDVSSVVRPGPCKAEIAIPRSLTLTVTFFAHTVLHRQSFPTWPLVRVSTVTMTTGCCESCNTPTILRVTLHFLPYLHFSPLTDDEILEGWRAEEVARG